MLHQQQSLKTKQDGWRMKDDKMNVEQRWWTRMMLHEMVKKQMDWTTTTEPNQQPSCSRDQVNLIKNTCNNLFLLVLAYLSIIFSKCSDLQSLFIIWEAQPLTSVNLEDIRLLWFMMCVCAHPCILANAFNQNCQLNGSMARSRREFTQNQVALYSTHQCSTPNKWVSLIFLVSLPFLISSFWG